MIPVTRPYFPKREKIDRYLDSIYKSQQVTNNGPLLRELTVRLREYLDVDYLLLVANGTLALQLALRLCGERQNVATTPFSFPATSSSIAWHGGAPVYVDIEKGSFNLSTEKLEEMLTDDIGVILPTHVFGNPCDVLKLTELGNSHSIPIVFDAAHAFGVRVYDKSILSFGDISILSFHATKLFHTLEGGALAFKDQREYEKAKRLINFGFDGAGQVQDVGINAKMNEVEAAFGLAVLDDIDMIMGQLKDAAGVYESLLHSDLTRQTLHPDCTPNHSYLPICFPHERQLEESVRRLNDQDIFPRRYFSPSLDTIAVFNGRRDCNVSQDISARVLCLPMYVGLPHGDISRICELVNGALQ